MTPMRVRSRRPGRELVLIASVPRRYLTPESYPFYDVLGAWHRVGRIGFDDVAGNKPVKEHSRGGDVLFDGRRRKFPLRFFHEGRDVEGLNVGKVVDAFLVAPLAKPERCI